MGYRSEERRVGKVGYPGCSLCRAEPLLRSEYEAKPNPHQDRS